MGMTTTPDLTGLPAVLDIDRQLFDAIRAGAYVLADVAGIRTVASSFGSPIGVRAFSASVVVRADFYAAHRVDRG